SSHNAHAPPGTPPLSLHDALPISSRVRRRRIASERPSHGPQQGLGLLRRNILDPPDELVLAWRGVDGVVRRRHEVRFSNPCEGRDRKSTRLNSSHVAISYAVFCLK